MKTPESMFEIGFFRKNPKPFFALARELFPVDVRPTPSHYFLRLLHEKKKLMRVYTQNIDTLERKAGLADELVVYAHGSTTTSTCQQQKCRAKYDYDWMFGGRR